MLVLKLKKMFTQACLMVFTLLNLLLGPQGDFVQMLWHLRKRRSAIRELRLTRTLLLPKFCSVSTELSRR